MFVNTEGLETVSAQLVRQLQQQIEHLKQLVLQQQQQIQQQQQQEGRATRDSVDQLAREFADTNTVPTARTLAGTLVVKCIGRHKPPNPKQAETSSPCFKWALRVQGACAKHRCPKHAHICV